MTRRTRRWTLWDVLRRHKTQQNNPKRTRISTAVWRRTHTVVHPERDLSEWVRNKAERDWQSVVDGRNHE